MIAPLRSVLLKGPGEAFRSQEHLEAEWERFGYLECPNYATALEEYEAFSAILRRHVDEVLFLPRDDDAGLDSIYTHDPVKITDRGAVLMNMGKPERRGEPAATGRYLEQLGIPLLGAITEPGRMDGGDVLWLDEETVALGRSYRTNDEGIRQFLDLAAPSIERHMTFDLPHDLGPEACLHLMSVASLVDSDLAVVYPPLMPVRLRQYLLERGYTLIDVPSGEYETLGSNVLAPAPRLCMLPAGNRTVAAALRHHGAEVHEYPGRHISYFGTGGPTCLTRPLLRRW